MKLALSVVVGASLITAGVARAQAPEALPPPTSPYPYPSTGMPMRESVETPLRERRMPAPANALELSVGTGYTQGFGSLSSGVGLPSVATPGLGVDFSIGYRADPHVGVLLGGQYQELTAERAAGARGFTTTAAVQYHLRPMHQVDPWVELGVGYRVLVEDPSVGPNLWTHGFQLARLRAGIDFRPDENTSIGPVIGADGTLFLFQDFPNVQTNIADPRLSTFVFAGLQGRFDIGGRRTSGGPETIANR